MWKLAGIFLFLTLLSLTVGQGTVNDEPGQGNNRSDLICYQCADSSGEDGMNDCQTYWKTMAKYRRKYENGEDIIPGKYLKNCAGFANKTKSFCLVLRVEERGRVTSFIRGCTDGEDYGGDYGELFGIVNRDNQTTHKYNPQGYLISVTVCSDSFCNGPGTGCQHSPSILVTILLLLVSLFLTRAGTKHL